MESHVVYYLGTSDAAPGQQHFYSVKDPLNHDTRKYAVPLASEKL